VQRCRQAHLDYVHHRRAAKTRWQRPHEALDDKLLRFLDHCLIAGVLCCWDKVHRWHPISCCKLEPWYHMHQVNLVAITVQVVDCPFEGLL